MKLIEGMKVKIIDVELSECPSELIGMTGILTGETNEEMVIHNENYDTDDQEYGVAYQVYFEELDDTYYFFEDQFKVSKKKVKEFKSEVEWLDAIQSNFRE